MEIRMILAMFAFASWTFLSYAQPGVQASGIGVGDRWVFKQITDQSDKVGRWAREVVAIAEGGTLRVRTSGNDIEDYDSALNYIGTWHGARMLVKYPLQVGSEWTFTRRPSGMQNEESGSGKIVARETLTVPAGTFDCYRIEAQSSTTQSAGASPIGAQVRRWQRWYCPEIKWIAKEIVEEITPSWGSSRRSTSTSELVEFSPGAK